MAPIRDSNVAMCDPNPRPGPQSMQNTTMNLRSAGVEWNILGCAAADDSRNEAAPHSPWILDQPVRCKWLTAYYCVGRAVPPARGSISHDNTVGNVRLYLWEDLEPKGSKLVRSDTEVMRIEMEVDTRQPSREPRPWSHRNVAARRLAHCRPFQVAVNRGCYLPLLSTPHIPRAVAFGASALANVLNSEIQLGRHASAQWVRSGVLVDGDGREAS